MSPFHDKFTVEGLVVHLFENADHDSARIDLLMALREYLGLGHNLGRWQSDDDIPWQTAIQEALRSVRW